MAGVLPCRPSQPAFLQSYQEPPCPSPLSCQPSRHQQAAATYWQLASSDQLVQTSLWRAVSRDKLVMIVLWET